MTAGSDAPDFYRYKYLNDPVFHAQVHVGAQAILKRWEARSVPNQSLGDEAWSEAKLLAFTVLKAVDAALIDGFEAFQAAEGGPATTDVDGDEVVR